jgi:hypothetical protein
MFSMLKNHLVKAKSKLETEKTYVRRISNI